MKNKLNSKILSKKFITLEVEENYQYNLPIYKTNASKLMYNFQYVLSYENFKTHYLIETGFDITKCKDCGMLISYAKLIINNGELDIIYYCNLGDLNCKESFIKYVIE
jgi:hypothetical protein